MLGHESVRKTAGNAMRRLVLLACLATGLVLGACAGPQPRQTFVVLFDPWATRLDESGLRSVQVAAGWAKAHPRETITVAGYAAPAGTLPQNVEISQTRAQVVYDQLVRDGVPASRIRRVMHGPYDYTLSSEESRQVEIHEG